MKQTPLKQIGKIGKVNKKANAQMKEICVDQGIYSCEVCPVLRSLGRLKNECFVYTFLSFAHRHKRIEYRSNLDMLSSINQFALACQSGHDTIEHDKELTVQVFMILRGEDLL